MRIHGNVQCLPSTNIPMRYTSHHKPLNYVRARKLIILHRRPVRKRVKRKSDQAEGFQLPGFSHVTHAGNSAKTRLLWSLICSVVVLICTYECVERVHYFFTCKPVMNTKLIHRPAIPFPVIVVCPCDEKFRNPSVDSSLLQKLYGNISYSNVYDLMDKTQMDIKTLWNISRLVLKSADFILSDGISLPNGFNDRSNMVEVSEVFTTAGTCFLAKAKRDVLHHGIHTYIGLKGDGNLTVIKKILRTLYRISYSTEDQIPLLKYFYPMQDSVLSKKAVNSLTLRMEEVQLLNTWSQPCRDGKAITKCLIECIQTEIFSKVLKPCRLPFMEPLLMIPDCSTSQEFRAIFNATDQVLHKFKEEQCTSCNLRQCHEIIYHQESVSQRLDKSVFVEVWLYIPDNRFPFTEEEDIYNFVALYSDVGGGLGFFLGLCALQVIELLIFLCKRILRSNQDRR